MTREEVADVITYCKKNDISYKARLAELGIPAWKFYDSKSRYALEQESSEAKGEFSSCNCMTAVRLCLCHLLQQRQAGRQKAGRRPRHPRCSA